MRYKIVKENTWENLLYDETYNGVAWIDSDKLHKYHEDSFLFTFEQVVDLTENLLKNDLVEIYCFEED